MSLIFNGSPQPTIGVEIELQIIDPETLDLTPKADLLLEKCQALGFERIKTEIHQSMLEVDSEISEDVKQCRNYLSTRFQQLNVAANELDLQLAVLGTHPFQRWQDRMISNHDRYQNIFHKYQWLARRMNVYGLHVHVGVESSEQVLKISNALIRYLPHLLALSASSPFWQGLDTGMQSTRVNIMESFPHSGIPHRFDHWSDFDHFYKTMESAGAIQSLKDLYWFIRPNLEFGTIEFRICDVLPSLDETMAVVALIQCLVVFVGNNLKNHPHQWTWSKEQHWIAPDNLWIAARDGLEGIIATDLEGGKRKISEMIFQLVEQLSPTAKHLNCFDEIQYVKQMLVNGNGALRQRKIFQETGSLREVVDASIIRSDSNFAMNSM